MEDIVNTGGSVETVAVGADNFNHSILCILPVQFLALAGRTDIPEVKPHLISFLELLCLLPRTVRYFFLLLLRYCH